MFTKNLPWHIDKFPEGILYLGCTHRAASVMVHQTEIRIGLTETTDNFEPLWDSHADFAVDLSNRQDTNASKSSNI